MAMTEELTEREQGFHSLGLSHLNDLFDRASQARNPQKESSIVQDQPVTGTYCGDDQEGRCATSMNTT
jgi:hypothetical protein